MARSSCLLATPWIVVTSAKSRCHRAPISAAEPRGPPLISSELAICATSVSGLDLSTLVHPTGCPFAATWFLSSSLGTWANKADDLSGAAASLQPCSSLSYVETVEQIIMATWAYPPLAPEQLKREEDSALAKELQWLLSSLQESLASLREGLQECRALLAPKEPGSTLVLSSPRSESLKGFVTRVGTKVIKGDIQLRLASLPPPRGATSTRLCLSTVPGAPELVLRQLASVRDSINQSLDVVDVGTYTGDPHNANFISGQLHLLRENIAEACLALKGETDEVKGKWWEANVDENAFDPPLPPYVSFHLVIEEAALVLYIRTLEPSSASNTPASFTPDISISGFSIRERLFGPRLPPHDEAGQVFIWKGQEVKVKEKIRVESQDPSLMSAMSKITALQHEVQKWIAAVNVVMGQDDSVSEE